MDTGERRARMILVMGIMVITVLAIAFTVILATRYPMKPTDAGDGLGLLIGFVLWPILIFWCIGGIVVLRRYRSRRR